MLFYTGYFIVEAYIFILTFSFIIFVSIVGEHLNLCLLLSFFLEMVILYHYYLTKVPFMLTTISPALSY